MFCLLAMSDPDSEGHKKVRQKRPYDTSEDGEDVIGSSIDNEDGLEAGCHQSDGTHKRPRGPLDCLNWSEDEDEFVPFTQLPEPDAEPTPLPKKVFAKKSSAKNSKSKNGGNNDSAKKTSSSKAKGKSIGKKSCISLCLYLNVFLN